jgi:hypothetical protein
MRATPGSCPTLPIKGQATRRPCPSRLLRAAAETALQLPRQSATALQEVEPASSPPLPAFLPLPLIFEPS